VLTESRRRSDESSGGSGGLGGRAVEDEVTRVEAWGMRMEYATCGWFGGLGLKTTGWTVSGFGPQIPGGGSGGNRRRHVAPSQGLHRGEAKSWRARGCRISIFQSWATIPLRLGGSLKISEGIFGTV